MSNGIVFLPALLPEAARWLDICNRWCAVNGYAVMAVAHTWPEAVDMIFDGRADVLVAGRRDHLPVDRSPRLEIVTEPAPTIVTVGRHQRRPMRSSRVTYPSA